MGEIFQEKLPEEESPKEKNPPLDKETLRKEIMVDITRLERQTTPKKIEQNEIYLPQIPSEAAGVTKQLTPTLEDSVQKEIRLKNGWVLTKEIARGGEGVVYEAVSRSGKQHAVKKMFLPLSEKKLKTYKSVNTQLEDDENILPILDIFEEDDAHYLVLPFIKGASHLKVNANYSQEQAAGIVLRVANGLKNAHKEGIIHKDIKPENILVDKDLNVKITDFGIASILGEDEISQDLDSTLFTKTMELVKGSIKYMSPEQQAGEELDKRTDIYSLSVVFYESLTGKKPGVGDALETLAEKRIDGRLVNIVMKGLKSKDRRYQDIGEMIEDLTEYMKNPKEWVPYTISIPKIGSNHKPKKRFDDIQRVYAFSNSDFKGVRIPWLLRWRGNSVHYASFLAAGTSARIIATKSILDKLKYAFGKTIFLSGVREDDLEKILAFADIPFQNAPSVTPYPKEMQKLSSYTKFDAVYPTGEKVGEIEYILPHKAEVAIYNGVKYIFTRGGIKLTILGSAVEDDSQYKKLQESLKKIEKR